MQQFLSLSFFVMISPTLLYAMVTYQIVDWKSKKIVAEKDASELMVPGSTLKLFTAKRALKVLGPNFQFENQVFWNAKKAELALKFQANPQFTQKDLQSILQKLKATGVNEIHEVIIDDSYFDQKFYAHGLTQENRTFCMSSAISAISIDANCFTLDAKTLRSIPEDFISPPVENLVQELQQDSSQGECALELTGNDDNHYQLFGCLAKKDPRPKQYTVAILNPRHWVKSLLEIFAQKEKIKLEKITFQKLRLNATEAPWIKYTSPPLSEMMEDLLNDSNNHIADFLLKAMGQKNSPYQQGNWINGAHNLDEECRGPHQFLDGSGLSRKNYVSAAQEVELMRSIIEDKEISSAIFPHLPSSKSSNHPRLQKMFHQNASWEKNHLHVVAKTGSSDHIFILTGVIKEKEDIRFLFSVMVNNFLQSPQEIYLQVEKILRQVI